MHTLRQGDTCTTKTKKDHMYIVHVRKARVRGGEHERKRERGGGVQEKERERERGVGARESLR